MIFKKLFGANIGPQANNSAMFLLSQNNTWTGNNTFASGILAVEKTDNGTVGSIFELYQNSANPAANDEISILNFYGNDSLGNKTKFADITSFIVDPTDGSEDGGVIASVIRGGVDTEIFRYGSLGPVFKGILIGTTTLPSPSGSNPTRAVFWNTDLNSNALLVGAGGGSGNAMTICDANTTARQIRFGYISTYAIVDSVNTPASGMLFRTTLDYTLACGNASRTRFATFAGTELATITYQKRFGIGTGATVQAAMHAINTDVPQLRLGYDFSNYLNVQVDASGNATLDLAGTSPEFNFSKGLDLTQTVTTEVETSDTTITIKVNGNSYKLLAKAL